MFLNAVIPNQRVGLNVGQYLNVNGIVRANFVLDMKFLSLPTFFWEIRNEVLNYLIPCNLERGAFPEALPKHFRHTAFKEEC